MPRQILSTDERISAALSVAESRNYDDFTIACDYFAANVLRVRSLGIYLLENNRPRLFHSINAPTGFLLEYQNGLADSDPMIAAVVQNAGAVAGSRLPQNAAGNVPLMRTLLYRWNYNDNLCCPVYVGDNIQALIYAAGFEMHATQLEEQVSLLCRSSALALRNIQEARPAKTPSANLTNLSPRLSTVARLLAAGNTNKQIARHLELSPHTVKDYVDDLIKRFGVRNRTEVAVLINRMSGARKAEPVGFVLSGQERRGLPIEHF